MDEQAQGIVVFHSIHTLFLLKAELRRRNIPARAVPTPRELSSDCGSALQVPTDQLDTVRRAVAECDLEVQGIHEIHE